MKDISSFSASQRMDDVPATLQIDAKQVFNVSLTAHLPRVTRSRHAFCPTICLLCTIVLAVML